MDNIFNEGVCPSNETLLKYVQGTLAPTQAHAIEAHAIECAMCSDALEGLKMIAPENVVALNQSMQQAINTRVQRKSKTIRMHPAAWAAIAAMLVIVVSISLFDVFTPKQLAVNESATPGTKMQEDAAVPVVALQADSAMQHTEKNIAPIQPNKSVNTATEATVQAQVTDAPDAAIKNEINEAEKFAETATPPALAEQKDEAPTSTDDAAIKTRENETLKNRIASVETVSKNKKTPQAAVAQSGLEASFKYDIYDSAVSLYNTAQYKESLAKFETILQHNSTNSNSNFYAGMCYYHLGNYTMAIRYYEQAGIDKKALLYEDALYYKALSLKALGQTNEAKSTLQKVIKLKSTHQHQAKKLLQSW
ncbi:MAG: tetratricopeptide repeat protein [Bacteroidia bacterium]|nr:tetratricopeptide repeat protein [Bacteroidia bacterium]